MRNGEDEYIELEDLKDPNNNYQITLLVPTNDDVIIHMIKRVNPIGYDQYINSRKSYMK